MLHRFCYFSLLLLSGLFIARTSQADELAEYPIAVLNVDRVFKFYSPLQERLSPLKVKAKELDQSAQLKQVEIETTQNKIRRTPPSSGEFEKLNVALAKMQAELKIFVERERRNLQKEEAEVYDSVYQEMELVLKPICQTHKIRLVIRQNDGSEEQDKVQAVLKRLNRPIVYEDGVNITEEVIQAMKDRQQEGE